MLLVSNSLVWTVFSLFAGHLYLHADKTKWSVLQRVTADIKPLLGPDFKALYSNFKASFEN
jgi:hypothetical protein